MKMWTILLITSLVLVQPCQLWKLHLAPKDIYQHMTPNVTLKCAFGGHDKGLKNVNKIIINRLQNNKWTEYAKAYLQRSKLLVINGGHADAIVDGNLDRSKSFLSVRWPTTSADDNGEYSCVVYGKGNDDSAVKAVTNTIKMAPKSVSFYDLAKGLKVLKEKTDRLEKGCTKVEQLQTMGKKLTSLLNSLERDISTLLKRVVPAEKMRTVFWPEGEYKLLTPKSGCPAGNFSEDIARFVADRKNGVLQRDTHVKKPHVKTRASSYHIVDFTACQRQQGRFAPTWPKGSFCIHRVGRCPAGFKFLKLTLDPASGVKFHELKDFRIPGRYWKYYAYKSTTDFCCRKDEKYNIPITLPLDKPFMLYRYLGHCQKVQGALVKEEWLQIMAKFYLNACYYERRT